MADRFPLILNTSTNQIQEIASGDQLDLTGNNLANAGIITATTFSGNLTGNVTGNINGNLTGTLQTAAQPNITSLGTLSSLNVSGNASIGGVLTYEDVTSVDSVGIITARAGVHCSTDGVGNGIKVGAGSDLIIQHNGTNSFIDNNTGDLYIQTTGSGDDILIESADDVYIRTQGSEPSASFIGNGDVQLYYDGSKKFETTSSGAKITGTATATGSLIVGSGNDLQFTRSGGNTEIQNYSGTLLFANASSNSNNVFIRGRADENSIICIPDGAVELYFDNSKKLETTGYGINITAHSDIRFTNGNWTGDITHAKIQLHNNILYLCSGTEGFAFREGATDRWRIDPNGHFLPAADSTYDIGTSGVSVRNFYADTLYGDGSNLTGIDTDLVSDTSPQLGGPLNTNTQIIKFPDSNGSTNQAIFGTGNDLKIYHQSNSSYIINATGNLNIGSNNEVRIKGGSDVAENMAVFKDNGAVELYHDAAKRLETTSTGCTIFGNGTQGKLTIGDTGDVDLFLAADSDNADESHNPTIHFLQDGGNTYLKVGVEGGNGQTLTNSIGNCPYVCTTQSISLQLGSNSTIRWEISGNGTFKPISDNTYDIGTTAARVRNIYVNDLQLSNEAKKDTGGNDVDGTWGDFTIQEGESDLYLINNRSGKKYKFNLTEVS